MLMNLKSTVHKLMIELFYPAVLGTIFYSLFPLIQQYEAVSRNLLAFITVVALLFHFCADFIYTYVSSRYNLITFIADIVILYLFALSFDSINYISAPPNYPKISFCMFIIYLIFVIWDVSVKREKEYFIKLIVFEVTFTMIFFLIWLNYLPPIILPITIFSAGVMLLLFSYKDKAIAK